MRLSLLISLSLLLLSWQTACAQLAPADDFFNSGAQFYLSLIHISRSQNPLPSELQTALRIANRKHDVVAVQITDRYELELPKLGRLILEDAETGKIVEVNTAHASSRDAFALRQEKQRNDLARQFRSSGVDLSLIHI